MPQRDLSRRDVLKRCVATGALIVPVRWGDAEVLYAWLEAQAGRTPTAHVEMGPFYKRRAPSSPALRAAGDPGLPLTVSGHVLDVHGERIPDATIDVWQANHGGLYDLDGYRYRAALKPSATGVYEFESVMPGHYPARVARHVHYFVTAPGPQASLDAVVFRHRRGLRREPRRQLQEGPAHHVAIAGAARDDAWGTRGCRGRRGIRARHGAGVIVKGCILTAAPLVVVAALAAAACTTPAPSSTSTSAATAFATDPMPPMVTVKVDHAVSSLQRVSGSSLVVIGFEDGHVGLWNGRDGAPGTMLKPHDARVLAVGSSADGRELYSLAADGAFARTPVTAGATPTTRKIDIGPATTRAAAFSSDGSLLATGGEFGDIRVFDVASGALRHVLRGHRTEIQALAIGSSAPLIATASAESDLRVWDANAGKETRLIESDLSLWAVAFSPRGDVLASGGGDRRLTLRDASSFATTAESTLAAPRMVATLAWSPDGRHIALGDIDDVSLTKGGVEIVEAATPAVVARLDTGSVPATSLVVLPEGVIVAAIGSTLRSWTVAALAAR